MTEPDPMKEIHRIREKNYHETKHMTASQYVKHIEEKAAEVEALRKKIKPSKDIETFFKDLRKKRKAS